MYLFNQVNIIKVAAVTVQIREKSNILFCHIHAWKIMNIIMIVMTIIIDAGDCDHKLSLIPDAAEVPWRKNVINYFSS